MGRSIHDMNTLEAQKSNKNKFELRIIQGVQALWDPF